MDVLKGAVVGCGMISAFHLKAWQRIPEASIVALCSRNPENARRRLPLAPNARLYTDYAAMLRNEALDFVDILTPPVVHRQYCLAAKDRGVHVICQKPICDTLSDAERLVDAFDGYPGLFAVHENHRYRPWFQEVLKRAEQGFFGRPRFIRFEQHNPSEPDVPYKLEMKQGVFLEHGTHLVDMMRALLGDPAGTYARMHHVSRKMAGESLAHVCYEYADTTAVIDVAWKTGGVQQAGFVLEGEQGEAFFQGSMVRGGQSRFRLLRGKQAALDEPRNATADYEDSFYLFQRDCVDAIVSGNTADIVQTGRENLRTLVCTVAAYESADRQRVVAIGPDRATGKGFI
jgi:predicted dehydrogenase